MQEKDQIKDQIAVTSHGEQQQDDSRFTDNVASFNSFQQVLGPYAISFALIDSIRCVMRAMALESQIYFNNDYFFLAQIAVSIIVTSFNLSSFIGLTAVRPFFHSANSMLSPYGTTYALFASAAIIGKACNPNLLLEFSLAYTIAQLLTSIIACVVKKLFQFCQNTSASKNEYSLLPDSDSISVMSQIEEIGAVYGITFALIATLNLSVSMLANQVSMNHLQIAFQIGIPSAVLLLRVANCAQSATNKTRDNLILDESTEINKKKLGVL